MSTTNGAGEPSMEEILASIRNIIAQEPPSENEAGQPATAQRAPAPSVQPAYSSAPVSPTPAPAAAATPFGHRPGQGQGTAASGDPRSQERVAGGFGAPAAPRDQSAPSPAADDFSDVFEEPLQRLPIAATPFAKTDSGAAPGAPQREPQLPSGGNHSSAQNGHPAPRLPQAASQSAPAATTVSPQRRDFDFGTLRPPRKDEVKPVSVASELFGPAKADPATEATTPPEGLAQRLNGSSENETAAEDKAEPPRRQVVIAAMPSKPGTARSEEATPVQPRQDASSANAAAIKTAEPVEPPPHTANGSLGLKTANVGFLAATPRPIDPREAKSTEAGRAFFDAIAGDAKGEGQSPEIAAGASENDEPVSASGTDAAELSGSVEADVPEEGISTAEVDATEPASRLDEPVAEEVAAAKASDVAPAAAAGRTSESRAQGLSVANIVVSNAGGQVRTLEDTVAELLRPLLREWLENNMPRIVESALRLEVADSVKKQLDGTSRKPNGIGS